MQTKRANRLLDTSIKIAVMNRSIYGETGPSGDAILGEDGFYMLAEDGSYILQE